MDWTSQKIAWIIVIPYAICGVALCMLVHNRRHCNSTRHYEVPATPAIDDITDPTPTDTTTTEEPTTPTEETTTPTEETTTPTEETTTPTEETTTPAEETTTPDAGDEAFFAFRKGGKKRAKSRFCAAGYHGVVSVMGTLLVGFTIIIYRLLIWTRTKYVMYLHMILHTLTLILFTSGLWSIYTSKYSNSFHGVSSWFTYAVFFLQYLVGAMVYVYLPLNVKLRSFVLPFHNGIGVWTYLCCVACCFSGITQAKVVYDGNTMLLFLACSHVCFICILIVMLSPFFELYPVINIEPVIPPVIRTTNAANVVKLKRRVKRSRAPRSQQSASTVADVIVIYNPAGEGFIKKIM